MSYEANEDVERLQTWWKTYGGAIIMGVVLGGLLLAGISYWRNHKQDEAQAASAIYTRLEADFGAKNASAVDASANRLMKDFAGTPYAGKAALILAKQKYNANDVAGARQQLQWAMENAKEPALRHVARLRLARLMLAQNEVDGTARLLEVKDRGGFVADYEELKGDVLQRQAKGVEARAAYAAALAALPANSAYARILEMKRDDVAGPTP